MPFFLKFTIVSGNAGMAKKNHFADFDDDAVLDKKTKRRMQRALDREEQQARQQEQVAEQERVEEPVDTVSAAMSKASLLCQESRWREALLVYRTAIAEAEEHGDEDSLLMLQMAVQKVEMSWRRQIAAAFLVKSKEMLKKEYLLDVGE